MRKPCSFCLSWTSTRRIRCDSRQRTRRDLKWHSRKISICLRPYVAWDGFEVTRQQERYLYYDDDSSDSIMHILLLGLTGRLYCKTICDWRIVGTYPCNLPSPRYRSAKNAPAKASTLIVIWNWMFKTVQLFVDEAIPLTNVSLICWTYFLGNEPGDDP